MSEARFDPNRLTFEEGLERIRGAVKDAGLRAEGAILTSRDERVQDALRTLAVDNVPEGFTKWQLPVYLSSASQLFVTVAQPGAKAGTHSHREGDGIRFVAGGSIVFDDSDHDRTELTAGDWMFIPAGSEYSFEVGPYGALMCYCYCCCCA